MSLKCLNCGKYCGNVWVTINGFDEIKKVEGVCKKCGKVDLTNADWVYEELIAEKAEVKGK